MNAFVALPVADPAIRAATARSDMLDGFADAETAVNHFLARHNVPLKDTMATAQLILLASKVPPTFSLSKANHVIIATALEQLLSMLPVRADIVHSRMHIIEVKREVRLLFINPRQASELAPVGRVVSIETIESLASQIKSVAARISKHSTNPPSPPQPAPDAASGP